MGDLPAPDERTDPSSKHPELPWQWEVQKEMNSHLGRLATLLGLVVTATALTLASEPFKDILTHPQGLEGFHVLVFVSLFQLGSMLLFTAWRFIRPLGNPVPSQIWSEGHISGPPVPWDHVLSEYGKKISQLAALIAFDIAALGFVWFSFLLWSLWHPSRGSIEALIQLALWLVGLAALVIAGTLEKYQLERGG